MAISVYHKKWPANRDARAILGLLKFGVNQV